MFHEEAFMLAQFTNNEIVAIKEGILQRVVEEEKAKNIRETSAAADMPRST